MHKRTVLENSSQVVKLPVALAWHRMFRNCLKQGRKNMILFLQFLCSAN